MQFSTIIALASSLALTSAAPTPQTGAPGYTLTLKGAADASYTLNIAPDDAFHPTNNVLSISSVYSPDVDVARFCTLQTVDYPPALVQISQYEWNVGPPQTVTNIKCRRAGGGGGGDGGVQTIHVEFQGADPSLGAKYGLDVKLDGSAVATNNKLSISTLYSTYLDLASKCTFVFADHAAALSKIATNTWAVGPPQWIDSISCKA